MIYVFDFETTNEYTASNKLRTVLDMEKGTTYKVDIVFPPGPAHLLHVQIRDAIHPVWPTNGDADFAGDRETITFNDEYPILEPPYQLECYTWNLCETYPHRVIIRIGIKAPEKEAIERLEPLYMRLPISYEF